MSIIYLVNPISGRGHLDAYARLYSRAFLELGHSVILLARDDSGTAAYLARENVAERAYFRFVSFVEADELAEGSSTAIDRSGLSIQRRASIVWREEGLSGVLYRLIVVPERAAFRLLPSGVKARAEPLRSRTYAALFRWLHYDPHKIDFATQISRINAVKTPVENDEPFAFFLYLDLMSQSSRSINALQSDMKMSWAGILFHPAAEGENALEKYFAVPLARGAAFLVPDAVQRYRAIAPQLNFQCVPDIADGRLPEKEPLIVRAVRERARGRKVVLLAGSLAPHKGVLTFLDLAGSADPRRFFFVLAGEVYWEQFGADSDRLRTTLENSPENLFFHEGYLADESDYNALLNSCDILYAVYKDFNSSSNSLTKASIFRKRILVSAGTLMGDWVTENQIGDIAPEHDIVGLLAVLQRLAARSEETFNFDAYLDSRSLGALKQRLRAALSGWCKSPAVGEQEMAS